MKLVYVVSAYKLPRQLGRLLRRLADGEARIAVHVDAKTPEGVYRRMRHEASGLAHVHFLPRHRSFWAGFGHVRTTLKGIEHHLANPEPFDYAILLTGQDYPLVPPAVIRRRLAEAEGASFLNWFPLPTERWDANGGLDRFERLHLVSYKSLHLRLPWRRRIPGGLRPFGGSAYWCLARPAVEYVADYTRRNPRYVRFFSRVFVPDELFFQTLLLNSPLRESMIDDDLRYLDWQRRPAPAILRVDDLDTMLASGKLFARKFDESIDSRVLDELDRQLDLAAATLES
ncbi:MAG TPA: beta-1,6-N-acetylglucosaminyltransferase [Gaiellaceae bacterium]|nr:beta-1,6-N-acetylglucosaminyltransferase [Gaiellaceae bacterium]